jgi:hypothetical protein
MQFGVWTPENQHNTQQYMNRQAQTNMIDICSKQGFS